MFFKNKFQKKALDKLPKREGAPCFLSFNEAKTVIFIFDLEEDKIIEAVAFLENMLNNIGAEWKGVAFQKNSKSVNVFKNRNGYSVITDKDLNYYGAPKFPEKFLPVDIDYDILIDFSKSFDFTTNFVSSLVSARFKIGRYSLGDDSPYDFVAKTSEVAPLAFLKKAIHYVESLKPA